MDVVTTCRSALLAAAILMLPAGASAADASPPAENTCAPWIEIPADRHSNAESPSLGCANTENLKNMVERPEDLEHGRTLGPANGSREATGMMRYEQGQVKPLSSENPPTPTLVLQGGNAGGTQ